jgi:hypothetical protein
MEARIAAGDTHTRTVVTPQKIMAAIQVEKPGGRHIIDVNAMDRERPGTAGDLAGMAQEALTVLLASLAARNVVKDVRYNGRTGGKNDGPCYRSNGVTYLSRTVVRPPPTEEMEDDAEHAPREQSKPHLRRGHEHTVVADTTGPQPEGTRITVVGAGRTGRRVQWFAPTYVNVDKGYISAPHYKVRP